VSSIPAVVLGATGYVGGELLRLIAGHPNFDLLHLFPAYGDTPFAAHDTWLDRVEPGSQLALFSAAPHGASAAMIAICLAAAESKNIDVHIVDASADFRYADQAAYEAVYGTPHGAPQLLDAFVCAVPEHLADTDAQHVGHPGCFATAILLAAVPLLQSGLTKAELFVTGITGSTGSGRSLQPGTHHPERHSNLYAYKPLVHRHAPEIASLAAAASGRETQVNFVPHSGPYARGIFATIQAKATTRVSTDDTVVVMSAIDNLVKGAAGGAVQWMNRLFDKPETAGLTAVAPAWT